MEEKICPLEEKICPFMSRPVMSRYSDDYLFEVPCQKQNCMAWDNRDGLNSHPHCKLIEK